MAARDAVALLQDAHLAHAGLVLSAQAVEELLALVVRGRTAETWLAAHQDFLEDLSADRG